MKHIINNVIVTLFNEKIILFIFLGRETFTFFFPLKILKLKTKVVDTAGTLFWKRIVYKRVLLHYILMHPRIISGCLWNALMRILFFKTHPPASHLDDCSTVFNCTHIPMYNTEPEILHSMYCSSEISLLSAGIPTDAGYAPWDENTANRWR